MNVKDMLTRIESKLRMKIELPRLTRICYSPEDEEKAKKEFNTNRHKYGKLRIVHIVRQDFSRKEAPAK